MRDYGYAKRTFANTNTDYGETMDDKQKEKLLKELRSTHLDDCSCALCKEYWKLVRANHARLMFEHTRSSTDSDWGDR